jgi:GTP-binding protein
MQINTSRFIMSNTRLEKCPKPDLPEYAFIGRSNVGKSSLINMLTGRKTLAKISGKPGKTQVINHFLINELWYLVDLPGYGYAKVPKSQREKWENFVVDYIVGRENLMCLFVLIDTRIDPQKIDLDFIDFLGNNGIPFIIIFTKTDKITANQVQKNIAAFKKEMLKTWESMPEFIISSSKSGLGKEEILDFISQTNKSF